MKLLDNKHPFFSRPIVRWITVAVPLVWAGVEFVNEEPIWGLVFALIAAYAAWGLLVRPKE